MKLPLTLLPYIVAACSLVIAGLSYSAYQRATDARKVAEANVATQRQINDSTAAKLAAERADKAQLAGLLKAADQLHGKLAEGVSVHVQARDTVVVHDTITTQTMVDSTRVAHFRDSTFAGTLDGTVTAPPYPAPLALQYQLHRPAFNPSVGFVQVGNRQVAVVVWQGERVEVQSPYAEKPAPKVRWITPFTQVMIDQTATWNVAAGLTSKPILGVSVVGQASWELRYGQPLQLEAGVVKTW